MFVQTWKSICHSNLYLFNFFPFFLSLSKERFYFLSFSSFLPDWIILNFYFTFWRRSTVLFGGLGGFWDFSLNFPQFFLFSDIFIFSSFFSTYLGTSPKRRQERSQALNPSHYVACDGFSLNLSFYLPKMFILHPLPILASKSFPNSFIHFTLNTEIPSERKKSFFMPFGVIS